MGQICSDTGHKPKGVPKPHHKLSFIGHYNKTMDIIYHSDFTFNDSHEYLPFHEKLAKTNLISVDEAQNWMKMYNDYMIVISFLMKLGWIREFQHCLCASFEVIQTWRLHIIHWENYKRYCKMLCPDVVIIYLSVEKHCLPKNSRCEWYANGYPNIRTPLEFLYNSVLNGDPEERKFAEELLCCADSFYKNELEFCFPSESEFFKKTEAMMTLREFKKYYTKSFMGINDLISEYRQNIGADVIPANESYQLPIREDLIKEHKKNAELMRIINEIENMHLTTEMAEVLAIEHNLALHRARKVVKEYKKYLFLLKINELFHGDSMPLKPSFYVAQALFLHIQNTKYSLKI
jgi:hypothetical protein